MKMSKVLIALLAANASANVTCLLGAGVQAQLASLSFDTGDAISGYMTDAQTETSGSGVKLKSDAKKYYNAGLYARAVGLMDVGGVSIGLGVSGGFKSNFGFDDANKDGEFGDQSAPQADTSKDGGFGIKLPSNYFWFTPAVYVAFDLGSSATVLVGLGVEMSKQENTVQAEKKTGLDSIDSKISNWFFGIKATAELLYQFSSAVAATVGVNAVYYPDMKNYIVDKKTLTDLTSSQNTDEKIVNLKGSYAFGITLGLDVAVC